MLFALGSTAAELSDARKQFLAGQYTNCIITCRQALANSAYQEEWHELLARSQFAVGNYEQAGLSLSNALERFSWSLPLKLLGQELFRYTSQSNRAPDMLEQIASVVGSRTDWRYRDAAGLVAIGRAALLLGADPRKVLDNLLEPAKKQNPDLRDTYLAIGELALEKHDFALAAKQFSAGLKKFPDDPEMNFGLARAYEPSARRQMLEAIDATLEANTNHAGVLLLLVDHLIDGEEYEEADKLIDRVLSVNPWRPEAWAFRAVIQHLRNDKAGEQKARANALKFWPANPRIEYLIGQNLSQKYRFTEGAACQRRALAFDASYVPAKAQLAQDLLRLGEESDGWRLAEEAHKQDEYDVTVFNLVTLKDKMAKFATLTNRDFILRMGTNEAPVYGEQALTLLSQAKAALTERYGFKLARPTVVEIFPEQKDFGVRTFGMPDNPGFLGVCFGPVITANSPASQAGHPANWQAVLWHEFTHVITLQMTRNKMPRWLSEGISVFEEIQRDRSWGQHMNARYREMILGDDLTPIGDLSSAFLAPKTPMHLQFAYFESALAVEFLVKNFGFKALTAILRDLGDGVEINKAIAAHTAPLAKLEKDFAAFARSRAEALAPKLDWTKPQPADLRSTNWLASHPTNFWALQRQARDRIADKNWSEAKEITDKLVRLAPDLSGAESPWLLAAQVQRGLGNTNAERAALEHVAATDGDALEVFSRLTDLALAAHDAKAVRTNAQRVLAVNPLIAMPHRALADAAVILNEDDLVIRESRVLLQLDPVDPASIHLQLGRSLHRRGDDVRAKRHVLQALEEAPRFRAAHELLREIQRRESSVAAPQKTAELPRNKLLP
jgi:tetratricopeptide (TPR) repeat protein